MDARLRGRLAFALAAALSVSTLATNASAQSTSVKTVLTIHSGAENYPSNPLLDAGIHEAIELRSDLPIDYFAEYLEANLFPGDSATQAFRDYIRRKYEGRRIDVVIAITAVSLEFALDHRDELFSGAAIVFAGLVPDGLLRRGNLTGVRIGAAYGETLRLALSLHPATQRVFVVANGAGEPVEEVRDELREFSSRVSLAYVTEETLPALLTVIKAIPQRSVILYIWHTQQQPGHVRYPDEIAPLVVGAATVPVYGSSDLYVGSGVVGGVVRDQHQTGIRLGQMAVQILTGTRPQDIPIETPPLVPIVDWRQVRRWGIDPARLPPGTDIRFRVPTTWELYRWYVIGTFAVVALQLLLIAALLTERGQRRRAEVTLRRREATLRTSFDRIRQLNARVINAQETARAEIASELHDDVCQELVGAAITIGDLKRSSGYILNARAQSTLSRLHDTMLGMVDGVRRLSHDLHPATLRLVGLGPALRAHCIEVEQRYDVQVRFQLESHLGEVHPDVALCLFRIAQEALRNGAVHGDARRLTLSILRSSGQIEMTVADDGKGFDLDAVRRDGKGLGLISMEERTRVIGGTFFVITRPGEGSLVRARVSASAHAPSVTEEDVFETA
jgi:signal transduction histidine kinase